MLATLHKDGGQKLATPIVIGIPAKALDKETFCVASSTLSAMDGCNCVNRFYQRRQLPVRSHELIQSPFVGPVECVSNGESVMIGSKAWIASGGLPKVVDRSCVIRRVRREK